MNGPLSLDGTSAALGGLVMATALFAGIWIASTLRRDASLVDRFWGIGFVVLAAWYWWSAPVDPDGRSFRSLVLTLVGIWGFRLSLYLTWRNWGRGEDYRYREMRERGGRRFWWVSLITVHLLQATILWVVSLPLLAAVRGSPALDHPLVALGVGLWSIGVFFETRGDFDLARFKSNPANRGRVLDTGVWRYTRHPNYFGDACVWWGFFSLAAAAGGLWTAVSPILMTGLLLRVSGVTLLEKKLVESKPGYRDYVERTSAFLPWPPRR